TIAVSSWHIVIDLRDHVPGTLGGGQSGVHADAKTAKTVGIWRRHFDQGDIDRHRARFEELFDLTQINRSVVGAAVVDGFTNIGSDKHSIVAEVSSHLWGNVRSSAHGHHVNDFHVANFGTAAHQRFHQSFRFRASWLNVDAHS